MLTDFAKIMVAFEVLQCI